jgi:hypothetical protein
MLCPQQHDSILVYSALAARKTGRGNDRVWKAWKAMKPAFHSYPVFGQLSKRRDVSSGLVSGVWNLTPYSLPLDQSLQ